MTAAAWCALLLLWRMLASPVALSPPLLLLLLLLFFLLRLLVVHRDLRTRQLKLLPLLVLVGTLPAVQRMSIVVVELT